MLAVFIYLVEWENKKLARSHEAKTGGNFVEGNFLRRVSWLIFICYVCVPRRKMLPFFFFFWLLRVEKRRRGRRSIKYYLINYDFHKLKFDFIRTVEGNQEAVAFIVCWYFMSLTLTRELHGLFHGSGVNCGELSCLNSVLRMSHKLSNAIIIKIAAVAGFFEFAHTSEFTGQSNIVYRSP